MLAELQRCSTLYATTKEGVVVMARMSADAQRLIVWAASETTNFKSEFKEPQLTAIRDAGGKEYAPWDRFFDELQQSFNFGRVTSKDGSVIECGLQVDGLKFVFKLESTTEDVQKIILEALTNYHYIHVHVKEVEKDLEEQLKKEAEVRQQAVDLERETMTLKEVVARSKEQDEINKKRLSDLQAELAAVDAARRKGGEADEVEEEDEELVICRARNPLGAKECKTYDVELLKLIKGKWITEESPHGDASAKWNNIVRPYTSSDLALHTTTFTTKQREAVWEALTRIDQWNFDCFAMQTAMTGDDHNSLATQPNGGALLVTAYALLFHHGCMHKFNIDEKIALNWISVVESGYHGNPYHNSMHAADVLHISHYILKCGGLIKKCNLTDEDVFAALFAATIHDYDHPGINNSFHIKAGTYLAILYNDRSVLENRHVSSVFELMKLPKFNVLAGLTEEQRRDVRDTVVEMVLATDMGLHAKIVGQFKRRLHENHDFNKKDDIRLALSMIVKMADISNCGRPRDLYLRWGAKIADEFYMQGDKERSLGMPCSPFMDRFAPAIAKGQIAFMNFIVVPLFECISEFLPDMQFAVEMTEQNKSYWQNNDDS